MRRDRCRARAMDQASPPPDRGRAKLTSEPQIAAGRAEREIYRPIGHGIIVGVPILRGARDRYVCILLYLPRHVRPFFFPERHVRPVISREC